MLRKPSLAGAGFDMFLAHNTCIFTHFKTLGTEEGFIRDCVIPTVANIRKHLPCSVSLLLHPALRADLVHARVLPDGVTCQDIDTAGPVFGVLSCETLPDSDFVLDQSSDNK